MAGTTNLSASGSESSQFERLDPRIRRWVWQAGWQSLQDVQERAIPLVLDGSRDLILAAATASGKTEAFFLPALTRLLASEAPALILYVSPLKALINDQCRRLEGLCEALELPVTPWHGDVTASRKQAFLRRPGGCLLITPESLEAMLLGRGSQLAGLFAHLQSVVVDELHAFIGSERGRQLQSLLHRLDTVLGRRVPRAGLSATLGDMRLAAGFLRPGDADAVTLVVSQAAGQELRLQVRGYRELPPQLDEAAVADREAAGEPVDVLDTVPAGELAIARHLFRVLRGANHLVFPNSRGQVECYADLLRRQCEGLGVPNEFWPHHGSLARELREEAEAALKCRERPATAICTTTLEMGIDIGAVQSIAQIGASPSVASLRQRLGRSGRRAGEAAQLRCYCLEPPIEADTPLPDRLHARLVQTVAMIRLLLRGWCEPPVAGGLHLSTLVQQLLSVIGQYGAVTPAQAWRLLCANGPFRAVSQADFATLLKGLGQHDLIRQEASGELLHGTLGERLVNRRDFYAAFQSDDEYRLVSRGRPLGTLPISQPLAVNDYVIFAGRRWRVQAVHEDEKLIEVEPARGGRVPKFDGQAGQVHDGIRQEMRAVLGEQAALPWLDGAASELLAEAGQSFRSLELDQRQWLALGEQNTWLLPWRGDALLDTLRLMLRRRGICAENHGIGLRIEASEAAARAALLDVVAAGETTPQALLDGIGNLAAGKWDWAVPLELRQRDFAGQRLEIDAGIAMVATMAG